MSERRGEYHRSAELYVRFLDGDEQEISVFGRLKVRFRVHGGVRDDEIVFVNAESLLTRVPAQDSGCVTCVILEDAQGRSVLPEPWRLLAPRDLSPGDYVCFEAGAMKIEVDAEVLEPWNKTMDEWAEGGPVRGWDVN